MRRLWAAAALVGLILITAACQVDVTIDVAVEPSGASTVTVTAVADAAVLEQVPRLADDIALDDLASVGWEVEGPEETGDGGLRVQLRRTVDDLEALERVLAELGAPLRDLSVERADEFARTSWQVTGRSVLSDGTADLVDTDALALLGAAPFATDLADSGLDLAEVLTVRLRLQVPGDVVRTTGDTVDGAITWTLPVDGTQVALEALSERTDRGAEVARTTADIVRFVLVVWLVVAATFVTWVLFARKRRRRRARARRAAPPA